LQKAIQQRDDAAKQLAYVIQFAITTTIPGWQSKGGGWSEQSQRLGKRLEEVYGEIQAINTTTSDAVLRHDEALALLDERAAADSRAAAGAPEQ
jgi:hypothetical protein